MNTEYSVQCSLGLKFLSNILELIHVVIGNSKMVLLCFMLCSNFHISVADK